MQSAASAAAKANNNFPGMFFFFSQLVVLIFLFFFVFLCVYVAVSEPAPTGSFVQIGANNKGVPQATYQKSNIAGSNNYIRPAVVFGSLGLGLLLLTEIL